MSDTTGLWWNDPLPIEGNDYRIIALFHVCDDTCHITYNDGKSEAEVFYSEIEFRSNIHNEDISAEIRKILVLYATESMELDISVKRIGNLFLKKKNPITVEPSKLICLNQDHCDSKYKFPVNCGKCIYLYKKN